MLERINLVPEKKSPARVWTTVYSAQLLIIVFIGIWIFVQYGGIKNDVASSKKAMTVALKKQESTELLQAWIQKLQIEKELKQEELIKISENLDQLTSVRKEKQFYSRFLDFVEKQLPETVICNNITIEDRSGTISGEAIEYGLLPEYVERLKKSGMFDSIALQAIKHDDQTKSFAPYSFNIIFQLKVNDSVSGMKIHG